MISRLPRFGISMRCPSIPDWPFVFARPDGRPCDPWTRGILQRCHITYPDFKYCGKEVKRKLEQGPVDHEIDYKCKVYENGRVAADTETLRQLSGFSEREISNGTGLHRKPIRLFRHGETVTRKTYQKIATFLREQAGRGLVQN